jgi:hypothetical protein
MGAGEEQEELLLPLIEAAVTALEMRLRKGVTAEDCGQAFPLAAAMLAMDGLEQAQGMGRVTGFTAGDVTIQTGNAGAGDYAAQAQRLLAPWLGETGFAFRGVRG